jgi:plasmid maintenance system antidote protein VapI
MATIVNLAVNSLKDHKQNTEFFDDIDGDNYQNFVKSIENDGVITPIIVSNDMTILSGHQRVRACKDLGIETISAIIRDDIVDEDDKLKKLLATNFGRIKNDPAKMRKVAVKYVELCGLKSGINQIRVRDNRVPQAEIAKQLGISERTLQELLELERKLTPEIKTLMDSNIINPTTAKKVWCKIDKQTQTDIIKEFGTDIIKKLTMRETQDLVDEYSLYKEDYEACKDKLNKIKEAKQDLESMKEKYTNYKSKIEKLNQESQSIMETMEKLKKESELKYKQNTTQAFIIAKISSAIYPLTQAKGELEKHLRKDYGIDKWGARSIDIEINFLRDFAQMLEDFKNKEKAQVVNYDGFN